jgi:phosphoesterase RecJ-like protein
MLSQVVELIEQKRRFAITSHVRPDGDSLGSSLGLYWLLRALDKEVEVIMRDEVPHAYEKLPGAREVRVTPGVDRAYDAVFVIECSDITRPGLLDLDKQFVVNIDHHSTTALFGTINWIDSTASAVGEMIYNLCKATGVRATGEPPAGVNPAKISQAVFSNYPWSKIELLGEVLATARRDETGRVAWMHQTLEMQARAGASEEDADGFVNYPLTCGSVEAVALLKECSPGVYRTSLRSKGDVNVARVAEKFGGGGHRNAAGCTLSGDLEEAERTIVRLLQDAVEHRNGGGGRDDSPVPARHGRQPEAAA